LKIKCYFCNALDKVMLNLLVQGYCGDKNKIIITQLIIY